MFTTVEQVKSIVQSFLHRTGRGGFMTGTVTSLAPLAVQVGPRLLIPASHLYVTDNCIGLVVVMQHNHRVNEHTTEIAQEHSHRIDAHMTDQRLRPLVELRRPLRVGDGVLLLCRPQRGGDTKYILLDRIQPYSEVREVDAR